MLYPGMKKIGREKGWHRSKNLVTGYERGYLVNMGDGQGFKFISMNFLEIPDDRISIIKDSLEQLKKQYRINGITVDSKSLYVSIRELFVPAKKAAILNLLNAIIDILAGNSISRNDTCSECGSNNFELHYLSTSEVILPLCKSCVDKARADLSRSKNEFDNEEKFYVRGTLGAIVFSLPGVVIWMLVAVYLQRIAAAVALLMAYASLKGYEIFGGKTGKLQKWILVLVNIVMVVFANYFTVGYILFIEKKMPLDQIPDILLNNEAVKKIMFEQIGLSFAVCFIFWIYLLYMNYQRSKFPELIASEKL
jgi:hypothetical protein